LPIPHLQIGELKKMGHAEIQRQLAHAEERVQRGMKHLERQREVVERLKRQGVSTYRAKGMLRTFNASLRRHQADRDRLLAELERVIRWDIGAHSEKQIEAGIRYIEKQQHVIAQLEEDGHDTSDAREILVFLERSQTTNIAEHERIEKSSLPRRT